MALGPCSSRSCYQNKVCGCNENLQRAGINLILFFEDWCRLKPSSAAKSLKISNTPQETKLKEGDTSLMSIYMCVCVCVLASKNEYRNLFPSIVTEKGIQMPQLSSPYHYQETKWRQN